MNMTISMFHFCQRAVPRLALLLIDAATVLTVPSAVRADAGSQVTNWGACSGQCLDANLNGYGPGSKVQTWQCSNGSNQHWYTDYGSCVWQGDGYWYCPVRIGKNTNLCLTANGSGNGAAVVIDTCNTNSPYDLWTYNSSSGA